MAVAEMDPAVVRSTRASPATTLTLKGLQVVQAQVSVPSIPSRRFTMTGWDQGPQTDPKQRSTRSWGLWLWPALTLSYYILSGSKVQKQCLRQVRHWLCVLRIITGYQPANKYFKIFYPLARIYHCMPANQLPWFLFKLMYHMFLYYSYCTLPLSLI